VPILADSTVIDLMTLSTENIGNGISHGYTKDYATDISKET
jgi:hypothetical protein